MVLLCKKKKVETVKSKHRCPKKSQDRWVFAPLATKVEQVLTDAVPDWQSTARWLCSAFSKSNTCQKLYYIKYIFFLKYLLSKYVKIKGVRRRKRRLRELKLHLRSLMQTHYCIYMMKHIITLILNRFFKCFLTSTAMFMLTCVCHQQEFLQKKKIIAKI